MSRPALQTVIVYRAVRARTVALFRERAIVLPTLGELARPDTIPENVNRALQGVDPDVASPLNLFRVHWHNGTDRRVSVAVPDHVVLPSALTGVDSPIIVAFGDRADARQQHRLALARPQKGLLHGASGAPGRQEQSHCRNVDRVGSNTLCYWQIATQDGFRQTIEKWPAGGCSINIGCTAGCGFVHASPCCVGAPRLALKAVH